MTNWFKKAFKDTAKWTKGAAKDTEKWTKGAAKDTAKFFDETAQDVASIDTSSFTARERTAFVRVVNDSTEPICAVVVVHKYSDVSVDDPGTWDRIDPGCESANMQVNYNTGLATTGKDWWKVQWMSADGTALYSSAPENFRDLGDLAEKVTPAIATAIGGAATVESGGWGGPVAEIIATSLTNDASTSGFKQHILRTKDDLTTIHIDNDAIRWVSPSGTSSTGVTIARVPAPSTS